MVLSDEQIVSGIMSESSAFASNKIKCETHISDQKKSCHERKKLGLESQPNFFLLTEIPHGSQKKIVRRVLTFLAGKIGGLYDTVRLPTQMLPFLLS